MDPALVTAKLESLRRCLRRLEARRPNTLEGLLADVDAQDILALNLERAVQLCVDVAAMQLADLESPPPQTMREAFLVLAQTGRIEAALATRLANAVTLRNILVHEYVRTDWAIVFRAAHGQLGDFEQFAREMARGLGWSE